MNFRSFNHVTNAAWVIVPGLLLALWLPRALLTLSTAATEDTTKTTVLMASLLSGIVLAFLALFSYRVAPELGLKNASFLIIGYLGLLYVGRPLFLLSREVVGSNQIGFAYWEEVASTVATSSLIMLGSLVCFAIAYVFAPTSFARSILTTSMPARSGSTVILVGLGFVAALSALFILQELRAYPGGWQVAMVDRRSFFEGRVTLVWLMNLYRYGFLIWLALLCSGRIKTNLFTIAIAAAGWSFALATDALSGSRMEIVLRNLLPAAMVLATIPAAKRHAKLVNLVTLIALVVIFVGYRTIVRDTYTDEIDQQLTSQIVDNVVSLPLYFFEGDEASAFDYLIFTRLEVPDRLPHRGAETLEAMAKAVIPSSFLTDKPERSSHLLTEGLRYEYSLRGGNIAFSGAADLYYSWGDVMVLVGYSVFGFLSGWMVKSCTVYQSKSSIPGLAAAVSFTDAASFVSVFRADLYEVPLLFLRLLMLWAVFLLLVGRIDSNVVRFPSNRLIE